jgi:hypothetical protein
MEYVKLIIALITSFFQNSTQKKKEELKVADAVEVAVVEKIRATSNANVIQQQSKIEEKLEELAVVQKEERKKVKETPNDDEQFGGEW